MAKKTKKQKKPAPHEKPVSLAGANFEDVLNALLKTKPMPKEKGTNGRKGN